MAWQVSKRVWDNAKDVKLNYKVILLALADKADENGICWPKYDTSYKTLGEMVGGLDRRSAMRLIDNLIEAGHVIKRETVGRGNSNIFLVVTGLSEAEKQKVIALISDNPVTITNEESEEKQKEMVTTPTLNGDNPVTNYGLNGDNPVTQSNKSPTKPSIPFRDGKPSPAPKEVKAKEPTVKQLEAQAMFKALADLCQYDLGLISKKERGELNQAEKKMRDEGNTPDNLTPFSDWWYEFDWRGKQGQPPTLSQIRATWGQFKNYLTGGNGRDSPPKTKLIIVPVTQESNE